MTAISSSWLIFEYLVKAWHKGGGEFEVVGPLSGVEVIAAGIGVRLRTYLQKAYGRGRWRKLKGFATVRLPNGAFRKVELHWYEAHGFANAK